MPDYRPDAPSVDVFTVEELLILGDWFGVRHGPPEHAIREMLDEAGRILEQSGRSIVNILDEWGIPQKIDPYQRSDAAVAQILLERVQERLTQWAALTKDGIEFARPILARRAQRKVELWPRHLLTINWADSGPGFSWPSAYHAIYVPGFDRTVVTESFDCDDVLGVCDIALGHFELEKTLLEGCGAIIRGDWHYQWVHHEQQRRAYLFDLGLVSEAEANAWADEVWLNDEGKNGRGSEHSIAKPRAARSLPFFSQRPESRPRCPIEGGGLFQNRDEGGGTLDRLS